MSRPYTNELIVRFEPIERNVTIEGRYPEWTGPSEIKLSMQMLAALGFEGASKWLGETILLLLPEPRASFLHETKDKDTPSRFLSREIESLRSRAEDSPIVAYELFALSLARFRLTGRRSDAVAVERYLEMARKQLKLPISDRMIAELSAQLRKDARLLGKPKKSKKSTRHKPPRRRSRGES